MTAVNEKFKSNFHLLPEGDMSVEFQLYVDFHYQLMTALDDSCYEKKNKIESSSTP